MAPGDSRRRRDQRRRQRHRRNGGIVKAVVERLPSDIHAQIHRRLDFLRRLSFASICCRASSGHMLRPEAPWLILPNGEDKQAKGEGEQAKVDEKAMVVSMADGRSAAFVRTAMRGHVIIGSSGGWLVTADDRAVLRMANPATGEQAALPAINTIPFLYSVGGHWFSLDVDPFVQIRYGGPLPPEDKDWGPIPPRSSTLTAAQMRQRFYRKVVLSSSPRPGSYSAMLLTYRHIGAPAFATAADPVWRMARSPDGVEDAIHHGGRFYSITYAGDVEAWQRNAETGEFTSRVVAPRLEYEDKQKLLRKYLAVSTDGQLMAVLKLTEEVRGEEEYYRRERIIRHVVFKVLVLAQGMNARWETAADIGESALFVGVNGSVCVSTREHQGIGAGCVYFTDDEVGDASLRKEQGATYDRDSPNDTELREAGVYNLRTGKVQRIAEQGNEPHWPPPAWFTPSFL